MNDPTNVPLPMDEPMPRAGAKRRGHTLEKENSKAQKSLECNLMEIARGMWGRDNKEKSVKTQKIAIFVSFLDVVVLWQAKHMSTCIPMIYFPRGEILVHSFGLSCL